jgi:hypothetical protein
LAVEPSGRSPTAAQLSQLRRNADRDQFGQDDDGAVETVDRLITAFTQ